MYHLLIVDNNPIIHDQYEKEKIWMQHGFSLLSHAYNAAQAIALLNRNHFDLVIADIDPNSSDALSILELYPHCTSPLVVLTSEEIELNSIRRIIQLGAFDFLKKPISSEDITDLLVRAENFLNKSSSFRKDCLIKSLSESLFKALFEPNTLTRQIEEAYCSICENSSSENSVPALLRELTISLCDLFHSAFPWVLILSPDAVIRRADIYEISDFMEEIQKFEKLVRKYHLSPSQSKVNDACCYLVNHMVDNPTLDETAQALGITKSSLNRLFFQQTDCTFREYHTMLKLEYAKIMLAGSSKKIYEISEMLGYQIPHYFTRLFKLHTGCTPAQYRAENRNIEDTSK